MGLLLAFAVLSIAVSFLCSILEAALLSITPSFIAQQKALKPRLHERLRVLKDQIDQPLDRKSTRLNSSHVKISYAVFCLKKKKKKRYKRVNVHDNKIMLV